MMFPRDLGDTSQQSSEVSADYIRRARFIIRYDEALTVGAKRADLSVSFYEALSIGNV